MNMQRDKRVDIFNLRSEPHWTFDPDAIIRIPEAHGDEIVRSVYVEEKVGANGLFAIMKEL